MALPQITRPIVVHCSLARFAAFLFWFFALIYALVIALFVVDFPLVRVIFVLIELCAALFFSLSLSLLLVSSRHILQNWSVCTVFFTRSDDLFSFGRHSCFFYVHMYVCVCVKCCVYLLSQRVNLIGF